MKLLIDISSISKNHRGMGIFTKNMILGLIDELSLYNTILVSCCYPDEHLAALLLCRKIKIIIIKSPIPIFEQVIIPILIAKHKPDFCWFPANTFPLVKLSNVVYMATIHDIIFLEKNATSTTVKQFMGGLYRKAIVKEGIRNLDIITSVSMTSLNAIFEHFSLDKKSLHHGNILYNSVSNNNDFDDSILEQLKINKHDHIFYTISGSSENKNLSFLIKSFSKYLQNPNENIKLIVTGVNNKEQLIFKKIAEHNHVQNNVIFTEKISHEEKNSLLRRCDCFIFISKSEGFGIPIIEALNHGCKVIASDISIFHEVGGIYINYADPTNENFIIDFFSQEHIELFSPEEKKQYVKNTFSNLKSIEKLRHILISK